MIVVLKYVSKFFVTPGLKRFSPLSDWQPDLVTFLLIRLCPGSDTT